MIGYTNIDDDLVIIDGSFDKSNSTQQRIQDLLFSSPGYYKQSPLIGADLKRYINASASTVEIERNVRMSLVADSIKVDDIKWIDGEIEITVEDE